MNLEIEMKKVAIALTGQEADTIPEGLEDICSFIAEHYTAQEGTSVPFVQVTAPADAAAAPTMEEFNGLIAKLKEAKIFK